MRVLFELLDQTGVRRSKGRPICFELGETWTLVPNSPELIQAGGRADVALTIRCAPEQLLRLLTEPDFELRAGECLELSGDPTALEPIILALRGGMSILGARTSRGRSS